MLSAGFKVNDCTQKEIETNILRNGKLYALLAINNNAPECLAYACMHGQLFRPVHEHMPVECSKKWPTSWPVSICLGRWEEQECGERQSPSRHLDALSTRAKPNFKFQKTGRKPGVRGLQTRVESEKFGK